MSTHEIHLAAPGIDSPSSTQSDEGVESIIAPREAIVHCLEFDDRHFGYFPRTGDLFELAPESLVALSSIEEGASIDDAQLAVARAIGADAATRVTKDLTTMGELGLFDPEGSQTEAVANRVIDSYISHRPRNLMFFLTERCNLKCVYCYESLSGVHDNGAVLKNVDGEEIIRDYFDRTRGRKSVKITFFGGEPLSNWGVFQEMVHFAEAEAKERSQEVCFTTTTNLTLLDEQKADFLVTHKFTVMVSIDGDKETHDANRVDKGGRGTYEKVAGNLKMLIEKTRAAGLRLPRLRATWVAGRSKRKDIEEHLLGFGTGRGLVNVGSATYDLDHGDESVHDEEKRAEASQDIEQEILDALRSGEIPEWLSEGFEKIDEEMSREEPHAHATQELCGVCRNMLAATPKGDYYPCHRYVGMEGFHLGNVKEGGLDESKVRDYYNKVQGAFRDGCGSCWARHLCRGNCSWLSSADDGTVATPRAKDCETIRSSFERMLGAYGILRDDEERFRRLVPTR